MFISKKKHYKRVSELLEANNVEVERRRKAEAKVRFLQSVVNSQYGKFANDKAQS